MSVLADTRELKIIIFNMAFFNRINHQLHDYGVCLLFILSVKINAISPAVANFTSFIKLEKQGRCRYSFHCN